MARSILHMLTPLRHMSPFDVNMAVDAGFETLVTYTEVSLSDVVSLTQDSIFSGRRRTGPAPASSSAARTPRTPSTWWTGPRKPSSRPS